MPTAQLRRQIALLALLSVVFVLMGCSRPVPGSPATGKPSLNLPPRTTGPGSVGVQQGQTPPSVTISSPAANTPAPQTANDDYPKRLADFEWLPNPDGFDAPYDTAKKAIQLKFGDNPNLTPRPVELSERIPALPFENLIIPTYPVGYGIEDRVYSAPARLAVLLTKDRVYLLGPNDYNDFLHLYGDKIRVTGELVPDEVFRFITLYADSRERVIQDKIEIEGMMAGSPRLEGDRDIETISPVRILRRGDPRYADWSSPQNQPEILVDFNTFLVEYPVRYSLPPTRFDVVVTRYLAALGEKGEVNLAVIKRSIYELKWSSR